MFAIGWGFLMLAVILAAASISHDSDVHLREEEDDSQEALQIGFLSIMAVMFRPRIVPRLMEVPDGKVG